MMNKEVFTLNQIQMIALRICDLREISGLTQEQVAERVGISRQHMGAIEAPNMVRALSLDVLFNIAAILEIEPYILLKFCPDK